MASLADINVTLQEQNKTLGSVNSTLLGMLAEDVASREKERRASGKLEEMRREAADRAKGAAKSGSTTIAPKSVMGGLYQGLLGERLFGLASSALAGMFGGAGLGLAAAAKNLGKGIKFGVAALALNKAAQAAIDHVWDDIDLDKLGIPEADKEKFKKDIGLGINAGLAARFFGARGRTSVLIALGTAFGDQIASYFSDKIDRDIINAPNPLSWAGIGPDTIKLDLNDPILQAAIGSTVMLLGGSLLKLAGGAAFKLLAGVSTGVMIGMLRKMGINGPADMLEESRTAKLAKQKGTRGFDPTDTSKQAPISKSPPIVDDAPGQPKPPSALGSATPKGLSQFQDTLLKIQKGQLEVPGLKMPDTPDARPMILDNATGRYKFASVDEIAKAINESDTLLKKSGELLKAGGKIATKVAVPVGLGMDVYAAATDEEKKALEVSFLSRMQEATVEGTLSLYDLYQNTVAKGANKMFGTQFATDLSLSSAFRENAIENARLLQEFRNRQAQPIVINNVDNSDNSQTSLSKGEVNNLTPDGLKATAPFINNYMGTAPGFAGYGIY